MAKHSQFNSDTNEVSREHEENFAKRVGGKRVVRSGAHRSHSPDSDRGSGYRGDVEHDDFVFELKVTSNKTMTLRKDWLNRIVLGAKPKGKKPAIQIQFNGTNKLCEDRWVMVEESTFLEMLDEGKNKE